MYTLLTYNDTIYYSTDLNMIREENVIRLMYINSFVLQKSVTGWTNRKLYRQ